MRLQRLLGKAKAQGVTQRYLLERALWGLGVKVAVLSPTPTPSTMSYPVLLGKVKAGELERVLSEAAGRMGLQGIVGGWVGSSYVLELPRADREAVLYDELRAQCRAPGALPALLGLARDSSVLELDLSKAVHTLVAGATGSGKSVFLHTALCSLVQQRSPEQVQLALIDPKLTEFTAYRGLPHLLQPVVTDMSKAETLLSLLVETMQQRYTLISRAGAPNLAAYNARAAAPLPYILLCIDEVADLLATHKKQCEPLLLRLSQKSRAAGVHMMLATQRPSADSMGVALRANLPTRIAFSVQSHHDSQAILGVTGAESLLQGGDGLLSGAGATLQRFQAPLLELEQITQIVKQAQQAHPSAPSCSGIAEDAPALEQAKQLLQLHSFVNASTLKAAGIVGSSSAGHEVVKQLRELHLLGGYDKSKKAYPVTAHLDGGSSPAAPQHLPAAEDAVRLWDIDEILHNLSDTQNGGLETLQRGVA